MKPASGFHFDRATSAVHNENRMSVPFNSEIDQPSFECHQTSAMPQFNSITADTLSKILEEDNIPVVIFDCRYEYEYLNGHIRGAINCPDGEYHRFRAMGRDFFFVFHCEFSSHRGPKALSRFRVLDRSSHSYPMVAFNNLYLLDGGYKAFFFHKPTMCEPMNYVPMEHPEFAEEYARIKREKAVRKKRLLFKNPLSRSSSGTLFGSHLECNGIDCTDHFCNHCCNHSPNPHVFQFSPTAPLHLPTVNSQGNSNSDAESSFGGASFSFSLTDDDSSNHVDSLEDGMLDIHLNGLQQQHQYLHANASLKFARGFESPTPARNHNNNISYATQRRSTFGGASPLHVPSEESNAMDQQQPQQQQPSRANNALLSPRHHSGSNPPPFAFSYNHNNNTNSNSTPTTRYKSLHGKHSSHSHGKHRAAERDREHVHMTRSLPDLLFENNNNNSSSTSTSNSPTATPCNSNPRARPHPLSGGSGGNGQQHSIRLFYNPKSSPLLFNVSPISSMPSSPASPTKTRASLFTTPQRPISTPSRARSNTHNSSGDFELPDGILFQNSPARDYSSHERDESPSTSAQRNNSGTCAFGELVMTFREDDESESAQGSQSAHPTPRRNEYDLSKRQQQQFSPTQFHFQLNNNGSSPPKFNLPLHQSSSQQNQPDIDRVTEAIRAAQTRLQSSAVNRFAINDAISNSVNSMMSSAGEQQQHQSQQQQQQQCHIRISDYSTTASHSKVSQSVSSSHLHFSGSPRERLRLSSTTESLFASEEGSGGGGGFGGLLDSSSNSSMLSSASLHTPDSSLCDSLDVFFDKSSSFDSVDSSMESSLQQYLNQSSPSARRREHSNAASQNSNSNSFHHALNSQHNAGNNSNNTLPSSTSRESLISALAFESFRMSGSNGREALATNASAHNGAIYSQAAHTTGNGNGSGRSFLKSTGFFSPDDDNMVPEEPTQAPQQQQQQPSHVPSSILQQPSMPPNLPMPVSRRKSFSFVRALDNYPTSNTEMMSEDARAMLPPPFGVHTSQRAYPGSGHSLSHSGASGSSSSSSKNFFFSAKDKSAKYREASPHRGDRDRGDRSSSSNSSPSGSPTKDASKVNKTLFIHPLKSSPTKPNGREHRKENYVNQSFLLLQPASRKKDSKSSGKNKLKLGKQKESL